MDLSPVIELIGALTAGGLVTAFLKSRAEKARLAGETRKLEDEINERIFLRLERLNTQVEEEAERYRLRLIACEEALERERAAAAAHTKE